MIQLVKNNSFGGIYMCYMRVKTSVEIMKDRNSHLCLVCLKLTIFCSKIPPGGLKYLTHIFAMVE